MIANCRKAVLICLALAVVAGPAMAQAYSGAGIWTSGGSTGAGTGGLKTFSPGSGYTYSITSLGADDALRLKNQGVRVVAAPADKTIYVTSQAGQPLNIQAGDKSVMPDMIVFGPGGSAGTSVWAGTGPGGGSAVITGPGVSISAVPGAGASVQVGGGAGAGGVSISSGTNIAPTQVNSFTGSAGDTYLITRQSGGTTDRVLVEFQ